MQIDAGALQDLLGISVEYFDEIDSTNLYCKERIKSGDFFEGVVIASSQTNGQGRVGKSFYSPKGSGLYLTFVLKSERFFQRNVTPAVAIAACRAIESCFHVICGVKWVNDIYIRGRKAGGILCQAVGEYVLIGIGINLFQPKYVPEDLRERMGWVLEHYECFDLEGVVSVLFENIMRSAQISDVALLAEYRMRCVHIGSVVEIEKDQSCLIGKCIGIDDDFKLLLEVDGKVQSFSSGFMRLKI